MRRPLLFARWILFSAALACGCERANRTDRGTAALPPATPVVGDHAVEEPPENRREALPPAPDPPPAPARKAPRTRPTRVVGSADSSYAVLRARFVDERNEPRARVQLERVAREAWSKQNAASGEDGCVELRIPNGNLDGSVPEPFVAQGAGWARQAFFLDLVLGKTLDLGDVVLVRECVVRGSVRDESGAPVRARLGLAQVEDVELDGARLRRLGPGLIERAAGARTENDGSFELRGVPSGPVRLWCQADFNVSGFGYGWSAPIELQPGEEHGNVSLVLPRLRPEDTITGRVVRRDGRPAAEVELIQFGASMTPDDTARAKCDKNGSFTLVTVDDVPRPLVAFERGLTPEYALLLEAVPGARDVELRLLTTQEQPTARLRVRGPKGEPACSVSILGQTSPGWRQRTFVTGEVEIEPGLLEYRLPPLPFDLSVSAVVRDGANQTPARPIQLRGLDPFHSADEIAIDVEIAPRLRGAVLAEGKPVQGAEIRRFDAVDPEKRLVVQGFPVTMKPQSEFRRCHPDGSFAMFPAERNATVYLRCTAPGFAPSIVGPFPGDMVVPSIKIELGRGGAIEGRALAADGTGVEGALVGASCGDGFPELRQAGADGAFRFDGLAEGHWLVVECKRLDGAPDAKAVHDGSRPVQWSCDVVSGLVVHHDVLIEH